MQIFLLGSFGGFSLFSSYTDSTHYSKTGSMSSSTQPSPYTSGAAAVLSLSNIFFYPAYAHEYLGSLTYQPLRIQFILLASSSTVLDNTNSIEIASSAGFSKYASNDYRCYFKHFLNADKKYKSIYETVATDCSLVSSNLVISFPSAGLQKDQLYELVISSHPSSNPYSYSSSNLGLTLTSKSLLSINFKDSGSSPLFSSINEYWPYQGNTFNTKLRLSYFYMTSKKQNQASTIFMKFQIDASSYSYSLFPQSYIEIEFPSRYNMFSSSLTAGNTGSEHPCYVNGLSAVSSAYQSPRCIIINGDSTNYYAPNIIRIESFNTFSSSSEISVSFEDILLPSTGSPTLDFKVNLYYYSGSSLEKVFFNAYDTFDVIAGGSSTSLTNTLTLVSNVYWTSTTASVSASQTNWLSGIAINDKIVVKLDSTLGSNINFAAFSLSIGSGTINKLYANSKNYYICKD